MSGTKKIVLLLVIIIAALLPVNESRASGEGVIYGAIEIRHICDDCVKYDLGVGKDYDYIGGRDHTFTVVIKDEYQGILDPEDVVWDVRMRTAIPGCGTSHSFNVISGESDVNVVNDHHGQTLTFPMEVGRRYEIWASILIDNKLYKAEKYVFTMQEVYRDPDIPNVKSRWLRPGQSWDLSDDHAKMFNLDNMATGGEDVLIGDHANSLYIPEPLRSATEISNLTFTAKEGNEASNSFGFDFGDYAYDQTSHRLHVVSDKLEMGLLTPGDNYYWYEPENDETLYVRYDLNLKEVSSIPEIEGFDSENNSYEYISKNVTSSENIRRSCGSFELEGGNTYFFEITDLTEGVPLTFSTEKPDDYDEIQENGNNSTSHTLVQNILGVEDSYSFKVGDPPFHLGAYTDSGQTITYQSSKPEIASVDEHGTLTINSAGKANITLVARAYTDPETNLRYKAVSKKVVITVTDPAESTTEPASTAPSSAAVTTASASKTYTGKAANPMAVKVKAATVKYKKLKAKKQTIPAKKVFTVSNYQGNVIYKKTSGNKKISVSSAGKITLKKGLKKGTYKLKVMVTATGNSNYLAASKIVKVKIKVK